VSVLRNWEEIDHIPAKVLVWEPLMVIGPKTVMKLIAKEYTIL
jgi:hypothetical protein